MNVIAANTQQTIGIVLAALVVLGWVAYFLFYNRPKAKPEIGSELELAANRKPYLDDEQLEGPKLDRALTWGLVTLTIVGVGLPLYWLGEPGRHAGAVEQFDETFVERGAELYAPTEEGGLNCAFCHGANGEGGVAPYNLRDAEGNVIDVVEWKAPALNTVTLRYSDEEIEFILVYGRPFSPMPAWGIEGGGPLNEQQIDNLVAYLHSIAISPEEAEAQAVEEYGEEDGRALFEAFCARCHTKGWSYDKPQLMAGGAFGPNLREGQTRRQFPAVEDHVEFITVGSDFGILYGVNGQGSGRMPGFGAMLTDAQIRAIVEYERGL